MSAPTRATAPTTSDDTEPIERIFIQWDYSYFFPSITLDNHVTDWGKQPLKFRIDVASMGKLGFDIVAGDLDEIDLEFCKKAIHNYHSFKDVVWHGDLYRLLNPHENDIAALMFVNADKSRAVVFNYLVNYRQRMGTTEQPLKLNGLNPNKKYRIKEINLYNDAKSQINSDKVYSGDFLMKVGINPVIDLKRTSVVLEINEIIE